MTRVDFIGRKGHYPNTHQVAFGVVAHTEAFVRNILQGFGLKKREKKRINSDMFYSYRE